MALKIGINGMGRIGRMVVRSIIESQNKFLKINHINNRSNAEVTSKLIKYDSIHGKFKADLTFDENEIIINKNRIAFSQESQIENIDWKKELLESGRFNDKFSTNLLENGAKNFMQGIYLGYMYSRWRKIRGLDKDDPVANKGQMQSTFKEFEDKIK